MILMDIGYLLILKYGGNMAYGRNIGLLILVDIGY